MARLPILTPSSHGVPSYKSGYYYFCNSPGSTGTSASGNGQMKVAPWIVTRPLTIVRLGAEFTAAGDAASVFRIGVFPDDGNGWPGGAPVIDAGTISTGTGNAGNVATGGTPGVYEITGNWTLQPGFYWAGGVNQGVTSTAPTIRCGGSGNLVFPQTFGTSMPAANLSQYGWRKDGMTGALPTWSGDPDTTANPTPRIFFKVG